MTDIDRSALTLTPADVKPVDRLAIAVGSGLIVAGAVELLSPLSPYIRGLYRVHHPDPRHRRIGRAALNATLVGAGLGLRWHFHANPKERR